jgi:hypothetical protein
LWRQLDRLDQVPDTDVRLPYENLLSLSM